MPVFGRSLALVGLLIVPTLAAAAGLVHTGVQAGPVWVVSGTETLAGLRVAHSGSILVQSGGTLVLDRTHLVLDRSPDACVGVNGGVCPLELVVEPGGRLVLANSTVEGTESGYMRRAVVLALGRIDAFGSTFANTSGVSVQGAAAFAHLEGNTFTRSGGGVSVMRGATARVLGNLVDGAPVGVYVQDANADVRGNVVQDASIGIRVATSIVGGRLHRGTPVVDGNLVLGGGTGIYVDSAERFEVRGNRIVGAERGITVSVIPDPEAVEVVAPSVVGNVLESTRTGVTVRSSGSQVPSSLHPRAPVTVSVTGNDLSGACADLVVEADGVVPLAADARWNWWGSAAGPSDEDGCPAITGAARADPWLTSAP